MFRGSAIIFLTILMFVGRVRSTDQKEEQKNTVNAVAPLKNATDVAKDSNNTNTKTLDTTTKKVSDDKQNKVDETTSSPTPKNPEIGKDKQPQQIETVDHKQNCHSKTEQIDMLHCNVTPLDDEDVTETTVNSKATEATVTVTTEGKANEVSSTEPQIPSATKNTTEKSEKTDKKDEIIVVTTNSSESTQHTPYDIEPPSNASNAGRHSTTIEDSLKHSGYTAHSTKNKRMPSGVIALVTAISFAVAIATVYIGMIAWRRYIEYRYGHRELLVNELEFDTNDLRHFEL